MVGVELGKLADGHRTAPGEFLDIVVGACHGRVLIVEHRAAEMLNDIGWHAHLGERGRLFLDRKVLKHDLATERFWHTRLARQCRCRGRSRSSNGSAAKD